MKASEFLNSQFIKESDLTDPITVRITTLGPVDYTDPNGKQDRRLQATLSNGKVLNLNATNLKRLIRAFGDDLSGWTGQEVVVYWDDEVEFAGRQCGGVRLRVPSAVRLGSPV